MPWWQGTTNTEKKETILQNVCPWYMNMTDNYVRLQHILWRVLIVSDPKILFFKIRSYVTYGTYCTIYPGDRAVWGRWLARIAGSNSARDMDVSLLWVLFVVRGRSLVQRSHTDCVCIWMWSRSLDNEEGLNSLGLASHKDIHNGYPSKSVKGKGKGKDISAYAIKARRWMEELLHAFLTVALDSCDLSASRPGGFKLGDRGPATHWLERGGGEVPPWTVCERENSLTPAEILKTISRLFT